MTAQTTPLQETPLAACHEEAGARLVEFAGWRMPVQYSGVVDEHRAVRSAAGLFDVSHMGEIRLSGAGAEAAVQWLTPNDAARLRPGRAHYSALLSEHGTYLDDLLVYRLAADDFLLVVNAANTARDVAWVREHSSGVAVEDVSAGYALLALQGPKAESILGRLTSADLAAVRYYRFVHAAVGEVEALLSRTGYTGEDGFEIYLPPADAPKLWRRLLAEGERDGLVPAGLGARDTLRLEAAMALYGHELDEETTPLQAGLDWIVKWGKGDFIGRDALVAERQRGPRRRLAGFEITGRGIARQGHEVFAGDRPVGVVTSGTWSPTLERPIGMAWVEPGLEAPGRDLAVEVRGRRLEAVTVELPFYRRAS